MKKGEIVLLSFPFTDLKGEKIRPALILMVSDLDLIVAFITTQSCLCWNLKELTKTLSLCLI